ncbi:hypothetical protein DMENIID0001_072830 [Sergentomyia squamirostris]
MLLKVFLMVVALAFVIYAREGPDYVYKTCRIEEQTLQHGQVWTHPVYCIQIFCYDGFIIRMLGCNRDLNHGPNCTVVGIQTNYDYPHCCPYVKCD